MKHLAIIMDGNGRYALSRGLTREEGHLAGAEAFASLVRDFASLPIDVITVYAFSTENANREKKEVDSLLEIIRSFLEKRIFSIAQNHHISVKFIGNTTVLPTVLQDTMHRAPFFKEGKTMIIALNYGGADEVARAVRKMIDRNEQVSVERIKDYLDTAGYPDPDVLIRYGGYQRLSNFMPLQTAYTDLFFLDKLWPEYDVNDILDILADSAKIKRNFGVKHD